MKKRILSFLLALVMVLGMLPATGGVEVAEAATLSQSQFEEKLASAAKLYPTGSQKYEWSVDGSFVGWECQGYGRWLSWYVWGSDYQSGYGNGWTRLESTSSSSRIDDLVPGDVIQYRSNTSNDYNHTIFVTNIVGDTIYYTDCNSDFKNTIIWGQTVSKSTMDSRLRNELYGANTRGYIAHYTSNTLGIGPHTCNKGTYEFFEAAHPHCNCYRCSICGEIWRDTSSSNYSEGCATCLGSGSGSSGPIISKTYSSYCQIKATADTTIMTQPCSKGTDASSTKIESVSKGKTLTAYELVLNRVGNLWYKVKASDGTTGYIPSAKVSWVKDYTSDIKITGAGNPPDQEVGDAYWMQGTVSSTYSDLTDVSVYVYAGSATSGTAKIGAKGSVSGNSYPLNRSYVDNNTLFNKLTEGDYTFVVRGYYKNYYAVDEKTAGYHTGEVIVQTAKFSVVGDAVVDYTPETPVLNEMKSTYTLSEVVTFTWPPTENTTHYNIWLEKKDSSGNWVKDEHITYVVSPYALKRGTGEYRAVLQSTNADASGWPYAESEWVYFSITPEDPTLSISTTKSCGNPKLSWTAVDGATGYEVYRAAGGIATPTKLATTTNLYYTDSSSRFIGTTYWYEVRAVAGSVASSYSNAKTHQYTHDLVTVPGKAATCTESGLTDGKKCSVCGTVTVAQKTIAAKGHTEVTVPGKAATCTTAGKTDGKKCSVCGTVTVAQKTIAAKGHTEVTVPGKAATCTESGKTDGKKCSVCGTVTVAQKTIAAKGHTEVTVPGKAATCTTAGKTDGKKCSVCGTVTVAQKTIAAKGHSFSNGACTVCGAKDPNYVAGLTGVTRIFGADRYETAFKTAEVLKQQLGVEKFNNIVVACGDNFADALGGSYLAAKKNAPILLVKSSKIDAVKSYIKANLNPGGTVYLLGGTAAIPAAMDKGLDGFNVKRLAGATRYDTNLLILEEAGVTNEDILICTGKNFADSLSAAAAGRPILLVKDSLNDSQKAFLQSHAANKKYILGGTAAVSTSVENQAKAYGTVERIGGNTRYETSVLIAKEFFPNAKQAALAYAQNFPDGLSGGALAYAMKAPLMLTASGKESAAAAYAKEQGITSGVIFGGSGLISDKAVRTIFQMKSGDVIKIG